MNGVTLVRLFVPHFSFNLLSNCFILLEMDMTLSAVLHAAVEMTAY